MLSRVCVVPPGINAPERGWPTLQSIEQQRGRLRVRRMIDGRRREVLHLPIDVLGLSSRKNRPNRPIEGRKEHRKARARELNR
jgi:hypothetical protein